MARNPKDCPVCGAKKSSVLATRQIFGTVRRRRECMACGVRWTTREITQERYDLLLGYGKTLAQLKATLGMALPDDPGEN